MLYQTLKQWGNKMKDLKKLIFEVENKRGFRVTDVSKHKYRVCDSEWTGFFDSDEDIRQWLNDQLQEVEE